jgi:hypothetical protein
MAKRQLFICIDNEGYEASLDLRKIYEATSDRKSANQGLLRIIDESGEGYLYPESMFVEASLPAAAHRAVLHAVGKPADARHSSAKQVMVLTDPRDQAAFVEALLNPPAPGRRLRQAVSRHRKLTGT